MICCRRKGHISRTSLGFQHHSCVRSPARWPDPPVHPPNPADRGRSSRRSSHPSLPIPRELLELQLKMYVWGKREFLQSAKGPDPAALGSLLSIPQLLSSETDPMALNQALGGIQ